MRNWMAKGPGPHIYKELKPQKLVDMLNQKQVDRLLRVGSS